MLQLVAHFPMVNLRDIIMDRLVHRHKIVVRWPEQLFIIFGDTFLKFNITVALSDICIKVVNNVINVDESNVWHSRLCHTNFGCMMRLANLNLISKFTFVKNSKCHVCVKSKQTHKPHKAAEARNLAPLELIHSDLCEMNGVLTKGGKKYFIILIDDSTRFCYIYLLKSKDESLHYFKIYKAEVENQLERKIKRVKSEIGRAHV